MPLKTRQKAIFHAGFPQKSTVETITIGTVVDTNDPQQIGRLKIVCPHWGDSFDHAIDDLPWATYMSPFGGQLTVGPRGPGDDTSEGGTAYGMWAIPKIGAQAVVMCVDGDPRMRIYMGCVYTPMTNHTMPHGRFMYDSHPELPTTGVPHPFGPVTSREQPIAPLYDNLHTAFGNTSEPNYEFRTRGADYTVAGVRVDALVYTNSNVQDDLNITFDGWTSTQGYGINRADPDATSTFTDKNYDSTVYAITTPGFHSLSMDDRQENCRVRFRTAAGHQIIMDDTNERVYIATAKGNNWIEMDQNGNIDIFTTGKISARSKQDINFTSDQTIRFWGGQGIHMYSATGDIRFEAPAGNVSVRGQNISANASGSANIAGQNINLNASSAANISGSSVDVHSANSLKLTAASGGVELYGSTHVNSTAGSSNLTIMAGTMTLDAPLVNVGGAVALVANVPGTPAQQAASAQPPTDQPAMWTNKVPDHEPYARVMTSGDFSHTPEFTYTDPQVGKSERGATITRGKYWRR